VTGQGSADPEVLKAKQAAVKLLAPRARLRTYLEQRLGKRGFSEAAVQSALDALAGAGYVDDAQYAQDRIEGVLLKGPQWRPALLATLEADGLDPELAEQAVTERLAGEDQRQWACEAARQRLSKTKSDDQDVTGRRLGSYLARRGFDDEVIIAVLEEVLPQSH